MARRTGKVPADDVLDDELKDAIIDALDDDDEEAGEGHSDGRSDGGESGGDDRERDDDDDRDDLDDDDEEEEEEEEDDGLAELEDALGIRDEGDGKSDGEQAGEQPRDAEGKFISAEAAAKAAADAKAGEGAGAAGGTGDGTGTPKDGAAAGAAAAEKGEKPADGAAAAAWEPLALKLDGKDTPIEEAVVSRANGHVYLAIPEAKFARFHQRLSRGVAGERMWRELDQGLREIEAQRTAPPRKSDAEIEAELTLALIKPHLPELLDDKDVALLEARIDKAKSDAKTAYDEAEAKRLEDARQPTWEEQQSGYLARSVVELAQMPELKGLTREILEEVYEQELLPVRNGLISRDANGEVFGNTQWIYGRLLERAKREQSAAGKAPGGTGPSDTPANGESSAAAGTTRQAPTSTTPRDQNAGHSQTPANTSGEKTTHAPRAEAFNRGVTAGARPKTTSVKANRGRPADKGATRRDRSTDRARSGSRRDWRDEQRDAEDRHRRAERKFMASSSFEFDEEDDKTEE